MARSSSSLTRAASDTFAERKAKFESKQINVGRERADHRRKSKTAAKKGVVDRGGQKRRKTKKQKAKKTARKKR